MKKIFSLMLLLATLLTFTACSGDEPDNTKLSQTSYVMYHGDKQSINGSNCSDIVWNSENEFVATVKNNVITGQYVGKTTVKSATKNMIFSVEVKPRHFLFEEPCLDFGASKAEIKSKRGTPTKEDATGLIYETGNANVPIELYAFQNGELYTCGVVCKLSAGNTLVDFLTERYLTIKVDMDNYSANFMHCYGTFKDPKWDYALGMQYSSSMGGLLVAYMEGDDKNTRSRSEIDFCSAFKSLESAIK